MFRSFFFAGFECATGYNRHGQWIDQIAATQHDLLAHEDYRLLRETGLHAAREGVRWPLVDRRGGYDFSSVHPFVEAARANEIDVVWDLFHYGYPDDLDPFGREFPRRFADYCYAAAKYIGARTDSVPYFTPINEPSYFAWAAGDAGLFAPHCVGRGPELKAALARAAIQGIKAILAACPAARIVNVDPVCWVVAPEDRPELQEDAGRFNSGAVFESWDMIAGRLRPDLGGCPEFLDILGINYYWTNQWDITRVGTPVAPADPRHRPLSALIGDVWRRYGREMLITETSHVGDLRPSWIANLAAEVQIVRRAGLPLHGVCLYPVLGMPEWHDREEWTRMGLWDLVPRNSTLDRVPHEPSIAALREAVRCIVGEVEIAEPMHFELPHHLRPCLDASV